MRRFLKWIRNPKNKEEIWHAVEYCKAFSGFPSDRWWPGLLEEDSELANLIDSEMFLVHRNFEASLKNQSGNRNQE